MRFLLDANILSETVKLAPSVKVRDWFVMNEGDFWVSVITLGEIEKGILTMADGRRRRELMVWFLHTKKRFEDRTLVVDMNIMAHWAALFAVNEKRGRRLPIFDSILAATAQCHGLTIATRNIRDFPAGVALVNPWEA